MNPSPYSLPMRPQSQVRSTAAMQTARMQMASRDRVQCACGKWCYKSGIGRHRAACAGVASEPEPMGRENTTVRAERLYSETLDRFAVLLPLRWPRVADGRAGSKAGHGAVQGG